MIDQYLDLEKNRPLPTCPKSLEVNVLRRLRLAKQTLPSTTDLFNFKTGFAVAMMAIMSTAGITLRFSKIQNRQVTQRQLAIQALDFDVFNEVNLQSARRSSR
jgi:hypothetical protein